MSVKLDPSEVSSTSSLIHPRARQSLDLFKYLAANPDSPSRQVIKHCGVSNLSRAARSINKTIYPKGLMIGCMKPLTIEREPGNQEHLWSVFRVNPVAKNNKNQGAANGNEETE